MLAETWLGCLKSRLASRLREGILFPCSGDTAPGVLCSALGAPGQEGCGLVAVNTEEVSELIRGLEDLSSEDRLREFGLFDLENGRLQRRTNWALSVLKGGL